MVRKILVLFGTPTSGKDTVSKELQSIGAYKMLRKTKLGNGRRAGYKMTIREPKREQVVSTVFRYGNKYYVLESELLGIIEQNLIPIICTTSTIEVSDICKWAVNHECEIVLVGLFTSFEVFTRRSKNRGDTDTQLRARSWQIGIKAIKAMETQFSALFDTEEYSPQKLAKLVYLECTAAP